MPTKAIGITLDSRLLATIDESRGDVPRSRAISKLLAKALVTEQAERWEPVVSRKGIVPLIRCRCGFSTDLQRILSVHVEVVHGTREVDRWQLSKNETNQKGEGPSEASAPASLPRSPPTRGGST